MTANGWLQIGLFALLVLAVTKPLGVYMFKVFESDTPPLPRRTLGRLERGIYWLSGVDAKKEHTWKQYAGAMLAFSLVGLVITYGILRLQAHLPFNPQHLAGTTPHLAFNTAVSFTTNTNWQSYGGETTMSYFSQMVGLTWHNFVSAAAGIGVALMLARGLTREARPDGQKLLGNFWVDLTRATVYVLLPLSIVLALLLVSQGVIQNFLPYQHVAGVEGGEQILAMGPAASQIAIKQLGTNGGGFFNVNSAHPFENPNALSNLFEMFSILAISAALTYTYGRMAKSQKQGWALFGAMAFLFVAGIAVCYPAEAQPNKALAGMAVDQSAGNMEGKEARFGIANSITWAVATTDASNGSVNSMHDSYTAIGGMVPLVNIQLGEVIFGGVGAGLYGVLIFVILSVFIAGLMVGRTPELLGKKIEGREMKLAMLYTLIFPLIILGFSAWALLKPYGLSSLNNGGPHGLTEILYAFSSAAGNNGSAFAGLNANVPFYDAAMGVAMLAGRFLMILPCMAIAGGMVGKRRVVAGPGTFPTGGLLFSGLLVAVIVIVGALTFFPVLSLGPILEHLTAAGTVF